MLHRIGGYFSREIGLIPEMRGMDAQFAIRRFCWSSHLQDVRY